MEHTASDLLFCVTFKDVVCEWREYRWATSEEALRLYLSGRVLASIVDVELIA